jgi:hypothetical protein
MSLWISVSNLQSTRNLGCHSIRENTENSQLLSTESYIVILLCLNEIHCAIWDVPKISRGCHSIKQFCENSQTFNQNIIHWFLNQLQWDLVCNLQKYAKSRLSFSGCWNFLSYNSAKILNFQQQKSCIDFLEYVSEIQCAIFWVVIIIRWRFNFDLRDFV